MSIKSFPKENSGGTPLYLNIIWNHHQPAYRDSITKKYTLPWIRLHGIKSYYPMASFIDRHNRVKGVFNISPSLISQIMDYEKGETDYYFELSEKDPRCLTGEETVFIRENFFTNPQMARKGELPAFRRLGQLEEKKNRGDEFSFEDIGDLQLLHNLAWINPLIRDENPDIVAIKQKSGHFSVDEKNLVLNFHLRTVKKILPLYRKILEEGKIELMASPFYHPILPLIINTDSALRSSPRMKMPRKGFACPDDAGYQIEKAQNFIDGIFDYRPLGLWPPEMAVSSEMVPVLARKGIRWTVTDEVILERTLKMSLRGPSLKAVENEGGLRFETGNVSDNLLHPSILCSPYRIKIDGSQLAVFFRDRFLSDLISFHYKTIDGALAAEDLIGRLYEIRRSLEGKRGPHIITLALDGENCWEHYREDSYGFLKAFYDRADQLKWLEMTTPMQFMQRYPLVHNLPDIATGSWNYGNLENWIGTPGKNRIWETLYMVRKDLLAAVAEGVDSKRLFSAWEEFYKAQGSDFVKWPDSTASETSKPFLDLFRTHLGNVYQILEKDPPEFLR